MHQPMCYVLNMPFTSDSVAAAQSNETLQAFFFKIEGDGLDYALSNYYSATVSEALQALSPEIATRFEEAASLLSTIEQDLNALEEAGIYNML